MAEIPTFFFQGRQNGTAPITGGLASVPRSPTLGNSRAAVAEAIGEVGQTVQQASAQFLQLAQQRRRERAAVETSETYVDSLLELEELEIEVTQNPEIFPSDRAQVFSERAKALLEQLSEIDDERVRAEVQLQLGRQIASKLGAIADAGQAEFIQRSKEALELLFERERDRLLQAKSAGERESIMASLRAVGAGFVASGAATQTEIAKALLELEEGVAMDRMKLLIGADPHQSEQHLSLLARGESGLDDFPDIPLDQVRDLLNDARQERRRADTDELRLEVALDKEEDERQEAAAIQLRSRLYADDATLSTMREVQREINQAAAAGEINQTQHASLLNTAQSIIDATLKRGVVSDPAQLAAFHVQVYGEPLTPMEYASLRRSIQAAIADPDGNINLKDATPLLREIDARLRETHYSKVPEYQAGVNFVRQAVGFFDTGTVTALDDPTRKVKIRGARALVAYNHAINEVFQEGGREAVAQLADAIAHRIVDNFGISPSETLGEMPMPSVLRGLTGSISERYTEAGRRLQVQRNRGEITQSEMASTIRRLNERRALEEAEEARRAPSGQGRQGQSEDTLSGFPGMGIIRSIQKLFSGEGSSEPAPLVPQTPTGE